jgi:CheY-like chemotaxis protein
MQNDMKQILVVDDDQEDHMIILNFFEEAGRRADVRFLENGQQAIDFLESVKDDRHLPGLIVLDLNMPIMNGTQTLLYLKKVNRLRHIPVVIFSTSENENERRKCLSIGAIDYLVKPSNYDDGMKMIEKFSSFVK